jgi:bifunctional N-acetylglucosamine-1-phosphate-uridyltransferase/glucosamine-1-phosphate-acetyltransferase GlmU-like protein
MAIRYAIQAEPTGMLDAVLVPRSLLKDDRPCTIWVTWCDQVAVLPETVQRVAAMSRRHPEAGLVVPTIRRDQPYIHFDRDDAGDVTEILHAREGDLMPKVGESDMGLFVLSDRSYFDLLPQFAAEEKVGAVTAERNFLPFIPWVTGRALVQTVQGTDPMESVGINTPDELHRIEEWLHRG